jgi:hypothetical protein
MKGAGSTAPCTNYLHVVVLQHGQDLLSRAAQHVRRLVPELALHHG